MSAFDQSVSPNRDPRVVSVASRFEVDVNLVVEDLVELDRWRRARATRPIVPWLMARHQWPEDTAHYYLTELERLSYPEKTTC